MYKYGRNVHMRTYRLLAKCKQDKDSSIIGLKKNISNNGNNERNDICYSEKGTSTKKEQTYENSLRNSKGHKEDLKNKSSVVIAEFSLGSTGKESLLFKLGLTQDLLKSWASNSTISPILDTLKKLEGFWKHGTFWGSGTNYSYIGSCLLP
ncbi:hypothetical protein PMALA_043630 [Plasmodium malariae]|uniref:Uncharacterized protein n=1 Tax=Plasmodium malariae TaxID=5858 RepID=A0A1A8WRN8_PLAMA|nr:hypothetical protein PMALA_043630 [Plasmodium malariae]